MLFNISYLSCLWMSLLLCVPLNLASKCRDRIENDCSVEVRHQCYFDTERTCFKHFKTNCEMEISACKYEKEYRAFPEKFCKSLQFMCNEEIDDFHWPPDYFDEQIANLRKKTAKSI
ncbi:uncharacterized protein LOC119614957 [Lucilia sericata]|uniref:uncharacterized protein LOC119614957 n=1 Tax=Lucilia sericata TaxID=13632 RepID=UPI0018A80822|nr:uncharacterized protein LOC119614957 [Lucilia sericata]